MRYGVELEAWDAAVQEAEAYLLECAARQRTTTYGELAASVSAAPIRAYSFAMTALISAACERFDEAHGTVLASLVCRKDSGMPGEGYFAWGERTGRCVGDRADWWAEELRNVYDRAG